MLPLLIAIAAQTRLLGIIGKLIIIILSFTMAKFEITSGGSINCPIKIEYPSPLPIRILLRCAVNAHTTQLYEM